MPTLHAHAPCPHVAACTDYDASGPVPMDFLSLHESMSTDEQASQPVYHPCYAAMQLPMLEHCHGCSTHRHEVALAAAKRLVLHFPAHHLTAALLLQWLPSGSSSTQASAVVWSPFTACWGPPCRSQPLRTQETRANVHQEQVHAACMESMFTQAPPPSQFVTCMASNHANSGMPW
jgi:hypothetical protein